MSSKSASIDRRQLYLPVTHYSRQKVYCRYRERGGTRNEKVMSPTNGISNLILRLRSVWREACGIYLFDFRLVSRPCGGFVHYQRSCTGRPRVVRPHIYVEEHLRILFDMVLTLRTSQRRTWRRQTLAASIRKYISGRIGYKGEP